MTLILTIALLVSGANESWAASPNYTVKKGDSLYKISKMHNVSISNLKSWNNLKSNIIHPNMKLKVASGAKVVKKAATPKKQLNQLRKHHHGLTQTK